MKKSSLTIEAGKYYWTDRGGYVRVYWVGDEIHGAAAEVGSEKTFWAASVWRLDGTEFDAPTYGLFGAIVEEAPAPGAWRPADISRDHRIVKARFRDNCLSVWTEDTLRGYWFVDINDLRYLDADAASTHWPKCEVWDDGILPKHEGFPIAVDAYEVDDPC